MTGTDLEQRLAELASLASGREIDTISAWRDLQLRRSRAGRNARRARITAAVLVSAAVAAVAVPALLGHRPGSMEPRPVATSRSKPPPSYPRALVARIPLSGIVGPIVEESGYAWAVRLVSAEGSYQLVKIDLATNEVRLRTDLGESAQADLAVGGGTVWLTTPPGKANGQLERISPATGRVLQRVHLPAGSCKYLSYVAGRLWANCAVSGPGTTAFFVVNPRTGRTEFQSSAVSGPFGPIAAAPRGIWFCGASSLSGLVISRHRLRSVPVRLNSADELLLASGPSSMVYGNGYVWALASDESVVKIDPATGRVARIYTYRDYDPSNANGLHTLTAGHGSLWFLGEGRLTGVWRVNMTTGRAAGRVPGLELKACGGPCYQIYSTRHAIWVPLAGQLIRIDPAQVPARALRT